MKKALAVTVILALVLALMLSFTACSTGESGKSAYEIALDNGFVGTETEWLESLNGSNGSNGTDGEDGDNGSDAANIDIYDLYNAYKAQYGNVTFAEFLEAYLIVSYTDTQYAAARGIVSTVSVFTTFSKNASRWDPSTEYYSAGAGIVYKSDVDYAYIITNYHVVYDSASSAADGIAVKIELYTYGETDEDDALVAEFLGGSITNDIAVLRVTTASLPPETETVVVADSNKITLGEKTVAIGNPSGEGIAATAGIISVDSEEIEMEALDPSDSDGSMTIRVIRTDTPINGGNSGGGLFNARGELIGITNAKIIDTSIESMSYAIPINVAIGIADVVIENSAEKCYIGIEVTVTETGAHYIDGSVKIEETLGITSVVSDTLASGKLMTGDVLKSVRINDGATLKLTRSFYLSDFLYSVRNGDTVYLTVERNGVENVVELATSSANFNKV